MKWRHEREESASRNDGQQDIKGANSGDQVKTDKFEKPRYDEKQVHRRAIPMSGGEEGHRFPIVVA